MGPDVCTWVSRQLERRAHPEQAYRVCLGLLHLSKRYPASRLNAACRLANQAGLGHRGTVADGRTCAGYGPAGRTVTFYRVPGLACSNNRGAVLRPATRSPNVNSLGNDEYAF